MKITSTAPPLRTTTRPRPQASVAAAPGDRVELGHRPGKLQRAVTNLARNTFLAALPAIGTCTALALGGANAAGLALAGGMLASGIYAAATQEGDKLNLFSSGGFYGLISGAAGMIGPEGVGLMAGAGAFREGLKWVLDKAENGTLGYSLD